MITLTREFSFCSAHKLPYYEGKCHNLHGHNYRLQVTVKGDLIKDPKNPKFGMIIDFHDLDSLVKEHIIEDYDHKYLNDFLPNPTAEMIVEAMAKEIKLHLPLGVHLHSMKLWETDDSFVEYLNEY